MSKKKENLYVTLSLRLTVISAAVVLLLAAVHYITKDRIAANEMAKTTAAIEEFFPNSESDAINFDMTAEESKYVNSIYSVKSDGYISGYAFACSSTGFGGDISMIVGISSAGKIVGVKVISQSETATIGAAAINGDSLLPAYKGTELAKAGSVSGVSGATVTSTAISDGVKAAASLAERILSANG